MTAGTTASRPISRIRGAVGSTSSSAMIPTRARPSPERDEVSTSASMLSEAIAPPAAR